MNQATKGGMNDILLLQKLMVQSDIFFDPQAFVLAPENVIKISREIVKGENHIDATKRGCLKALDLISEAQKSGNLMDDPKELDWVKTLQDDITSIPIAESDFVELMRPTIDLSKIILSEYGL
jgi:methanol--5-hydroxybenzimidazolylcobamide Co-methyltransferase